MLLTKLSTSSFSCVSLFLQNVQACSTSPFSPNLAIVAWKFIRKGPKYSMRQLRMKRKRGCLLSSKRSFSSSKLSTQYLCKLWTISLPQQALPSNCFLSPSSFSAQQIRMSAKCTSSLASVNSLAILLSWLEKMISLTFLQSKAVLPLEGTELMVILARYLMKLSLLHFSFVRMYYIVSTRFQAQRWLRSLLLARSTISFTFRSTCREFPRCSKRATIFFGSRSFRLLSSLNSPLMWDIDMQPQNELLAGLNPSLPLTTLYILQSRASRDMRASASGCFRGLDFA